MPHVIDKPEALLRLAAHRRELFGERGDGCVMCALVRRSLETPALIAQNEHGVVVLDRFGATPGHCLVIAKPHVEDACDLDWPRYAALQRLAYDTARALRRAFAPVRTYVALLGASEGLPMSFPHVHLHVLPVYESDDRARPAHVFSWSSGVLVYDDQEALATAARLRDAFTRCTTVGD